MSESTVPGSGRGGVFVEIRDRLRLDPRSEKDTDQLRRAVAEVCDDPRMRDEFIEGARWSASFSTERDRTTTKLAAETTEHVVTSCFAREPDIALDLLRRAKDAVPGTYHFDVVRARLLAVAGKLEEARRAAESAKELGSIHALALGANIEAEIARRGVVGYRPGMFDAASKWVSDEPTADWPLIDLTAVLSTRARLHMERAVWEAPREKREAVASALSAFERLSGAPFIEAVRTRALDVLCFFAGASPGSPSACHRAAVETKNLGAAERSQVPIDVTFDQARYARLTAARDMLSGFVPTDFVVLVVRGDEAELVEWGLPAALLLSRIAAKTRNLVLVDRTDGERASRLGIHIVKEAGLDPVLHIRAEKNPLTMSCVAATLAKRSVPGACPLDGSSRARLRRLGAFKFAVLLGRDLDAEIDDLSTYELETWLLSFRIHRVEKAVVTEFKSLSDVHIVAPGSEEPWPR